MDGYDTASGGLLQLKVAHYRGGDQRFGRAFRAVREDLNLSMGHIARLIGQPVTYVSDIERCYRPPFSASELELINRELAARLTQLAAIEELL